MIITDPVLKRKILSAVGDEISLNIITFISNKPESVLAIISKTGIPSSSIYRRISELEEEGLIVIKHIVYTRKGKTLKIYKSVFKEISIKLKDGNIVVDVVPNTDIYEKAGQFFNTFKRGKNE